MSINWTKDLPTDSGWYWNRKNKFKKENIYYVWISLEESVGKDVNVLYCRWSNEQLSDKRRVEEVGGEWHGPIKPPE
jgi:hypothetical protein